MFSVYGYRGPHRSFRGSGDPLAEELKLVKDKSQPNETKTFRSVYFLCVCMSLYVFASVYYFSSGLSNYLSVFKSISLTACTFICVNLLEGLVCQFGYTEMIDGQYIIQHHITMAAYILTLVGCTSFFCCVVLQDYCILICVCI